MGQMILQGDCVAVLRTLPDASAQMCVTSPPYYGLRDYGVAGQIGLEDTPAMYIARLVEVFREVRRVLYNDGLLWLNLGDSYAGSTGIGGRPGDKQWTNAGSRLPLTQRPKTPANMKTKDLMMIPARVAIALQEDGWYLRSDIIWVKSNCMPESVTDRPTSAHEHLFLLAKSEKYYYDALAIAEPATYLEARIGRVGLYQHKAMKLDRHHAAYKADRDLTTRNKRNVWTINSSPYSEAHFATFPPKLIEPCILAGSRVGDVVLDPFMGAGTTALVALRYKRRYLGIELNPEYIALAEKRIAHVQQGLWIDDAEVSA